MTDMSKIFRVHCLENNLTNWPHSSKEPYLAMKHPKYKVYENCNFLAKVQIAKPIVIKLLCVIQVRKICLHIFFFPNILCRPLLRVAFPTYQFGVGVSLAMWPELGFELVQCNFSNNHCWGPKYLWQPMLCHIVSWFLTLNVIYRTFE